jgi:hypothetical protein
MIGPARRLEFDFYKSGAYHGVLRRIYSKTLIRRIILRKIYVFNNLAIREPK